MAIVLPAPAVPDVSLYADRRSAGLSPVGPAVASGLPLALVTTLAWHAAAPLAAGPHTRAEWAHPAEAGAPAARAAAAAASRILRWCCKGAPPLEIEGTLVALERGGDRTWALAFALEHRDRVLELEGEGDVVEPVEQPVAALLLDLEADRPAREADLQRLEVDLALAGRHQRADLLLGEPDGEQADLQAV